MTMPQQGRAGPAFEQLAQEVIAGVRPRPRYLPPELPPSPQDRAEAEKVKREKDRRCRLCLGYPVLSETSPPGCPRLASFELGADGRVKAGTFWPGTKWKKGRVEFA